MSNIDKQVLIEKIKKQTESFDTVVLKEDEANALLDELEAKDKRNAELEDLLEAEIKSWMQRYDSANNRRESAEKRIAELEAREVKFSLPAELTAEDCDVLARTVEYGTGWNLAISSCEEKFIHALNSAGIRIDSED